MIELFKNWRAHAFGFASWLIPFLAAFAFFDQAGTLQIGEPLFKSIMVVVGGASGILLLISIFKHIKPELKSGLLIGIYWFVLNLVLDWIVLLPMSGQSIGGHFQDIGLRYLVIPMIATCMGVVAQRSR